MGRSARLKGKGFFVTGTDTDVGKTVATLSLAVALRQKGFSVGVMKPVQCGGDDAQFLKKELNLKEDIDTINPYFAKEPLSPHLAFQRAKKNISIPVIKKCYERLKEQYDIVLIEGAGGLMVPIKHNYLVADLISDLETPVVIVSRLALGTINHTLLTIEQARMRDLEVKGIIFSQPTRESQGIPEKTNPQAIKKFGKVDILGTLPYLKKVNAAEIEEQVSLNCKPLLKVNRSTQRTSQLKADDKKYVWHPFTQMKDWENDEPLMIEKGKGAYLEDTDGNEYLDGVSSLWVNVHGHRQKDIDRAIRAQLNRLGHSTLLGLSNPPAVELAKKLVEIAPRGLDKVFYSDSGSTAVEIAVKMAYQYWQNIGKTKKKKLVHLANSYHGDTLGSVSVGGIGLFHKVYRDLVIPTIQIDIGDCLRAPKGKHYPQYAFECLEEFEQLLKTKHHEIATLIAEPIVQGAAGMIVWPKGVLKKMRALCQKYDVLFIADEVATGFGRTGTMFACDQEGVVPDIMCLAKGLTGGYLPLAATLASKKIYDGFIFDYKDQKTFFHGHTYTGNPLCCAAALANLEVFAKKQVLEKLGPKINHLRKRLKMFYNLDFVGDVRQKGLMVGIEIVKNKETLEPYPWEERIGVRVCERLREKGIILRPLGNVIVFMPPLSITKQELDLLMDATYWAIKEVTKKNELTKIN